MLANCKWQVERPWYSECTSVFVCVCVCVCVCTKLYHCYKSLQPALSLKIILFLKGFALLLSEVNILLSRVSAFPLPPSSLPSFAVYIDNLPCNCVFPSHNHKNTNNIDGKGNTFSCCLVTTTATAITAKSLQSCPTLCDPTDSSPPGSSVHGVFQAPLLVSLIRSFGSFQ